MMRKHLIIGMAFNARMQPQEIALALRISGGYVRTELCRYRRGNGIPAPAEARVRREIVILAAKGNIRPAFIAGALGMSRHTVKSILDDERPNDPAIPIFKPGPAPGRRKRQCS